MFDSGECVEDSELDAFARKGGNDQAQGGDEPMQRGAEPTEKELPGETMQDGSGNRTVPEIETVSGSKRRASETSDIEDQPPIKSAPRPRRFTKAPQTKLKPASSVIAEILRIQKARDKETQAMQSRQDAPDQAWLKLENERQKREARMEEMQKERDSKEREERERRRQREDEDDKRQKRLEQLADEDRVVRQQLLSEQKKREEREEQRREERFQQEMDEKRIRMWLTLRGEFGDDKAGRMAWGEGWAKERNRFSTGLTTCSD